MAEINAKCVLALGLYKPDEYGIGEDLEGKNEEDLKELRAIAHKNLNELSQHMHINAFHDVWLGSTSCGLLECLPHDLLECLPHDMMHAFLHGVLMYVIEVIISPLNPTEKFQLDTIVDEIIVPVRSSMKKTYPRCSFTYGVTNLNLITADERAGVAFVLALVAASKPGSGKKPKSQCRFG